MAMSKSNMTKKTLKCEIIGGHSTMYPKIMIHGEMQK
jgi:hypothetical protein